MCVVFRSMPYLSSAFPPWIPGILEVYCFVNAMTCPFPLRFHNTFTMTANRILFQILAVTLVDKSVIAGSADMTLRMWDVDTGHATGTFFSHAPVTDVTMTTDGGHVAAMLGLEQPRLLLLDTMNQSTL